MGSFPSIRSRAPISIFPLRGKKRTLPSVLNSGMTNLGIRELTGDDADDFRNLRLRALKEHPDAFGSSYEAESTTPIEAAAERLRRNAESQDAFTLGAYRGNDLVGMVGFFQESRDKMRHRGTIWGMYVPAEEQGKGIGRALLARAIELARRLPGLEQIELAVVTRNRRARGLYASLGFETWGTEPRALLLDGEYLDEEHMALLLADGDLCITRH